MQVIKARNVNEALLLGLDHLAIEGEWRESRAGKVIESVSPVTTTYTHPNERVLFSKPRDANPFFHFLEGLWMLNGQNDVETVAFYVKRMAEFSDDGETLWGAYGYRWLNHFGYSVGHDRNQIKKIINILRENPDDRRCVLQMWDALQDLDKEGNDIPCNTNIYFKIRDNKLQMTVCCRSNDMIWGAYGANAVHMSMLHEVMASAVGVELGEYHQISDSFHAYEKVYKPLQEEIGLLDYYAIQYPLTGISNAYELNDVNPYPIVSTPYEEWVLDLDTFMYDLKRWKHKARKLEGGHCKDAFFNEVAYPIARSYAFYKDTAIDMAIKTTEQIKAEDWSLACKQWLERRTVKEESHEDIEAVL